MGRTPCCDRAAVKRGPWSPEEDDALRDYMRRYGNNGSWITLPHRAGLRRCGKSCRLRWLNYLRPDIRHGGFTDEEDALIYSLYSQIGSKWSLIASKLERRTDNDVKNHWNTKLKKRLAAAATFSSTRSPSFSPLPAPTPPPAPAHPSSSLLFPFAAPTVKAEAYSTYDDGGEFLAPPAALHDPFAAAEGSTSASLSAASSGSNWSSAVDNGPADAGAGGGGGFFADFCTAAVSDLDAADQFLTGFYYPLDATVSLV